MRKFFDRLYVACALFNVIDDLRHSRRPLWTLAEHAVVFAAVWLPA